MDAAVADAFLTALAPAELDALSRARRSQSQVDAALLANTKRQVERTRYAAALAERQFNRVDPDNRLVASELERRWECALKEVRAAEAALAEQSAPQSPSQMPLGKALNSKIVILAGRLPQIWSDAATTDAHRKALLRCLVDKVVLDRGARDITLARIVWRGGAVTDLEVKMPVCSIAKLTRGKEMSDRLLELARTGMPDDEIADILTSEGHRSPHSPDQVFPVTVQRIRLAAGIKMAVQRNRWHHDRSLLSSNELAAKLGIPVNWLYVQIRKKRLLINRQPNGAYLFPGSPGTLEAIRNLREHAITCLDLRICQRHKKGHQHG